MRNKISGAYSGTGGSKGVDVDVDVGEDIERRAKRLGETVTGVTWLGGV